MCHKKKTTVLSPLNASEEDGPLLAPFDATEPPPPSPPAFEARDVLPDRLPEADDDLVDVPPNPPPELAAAIPVSPMLYCSRRLFAVLGSAAWAVLSGGMGRGRGREGGRGRERGIEGERQGKREEKREREGGRDRERERERRREREREREERQKQRGRERVSQLVLPSFNNGRHGLLSNDRRTCVHPFAKVKPPLFTPTILSTVATSLILIQQKETASKPRQTEIL